MKQTGVTRRIDELGRIVIPKEIRKNLKIRNNDELMININDDNIVLSKYDSFTSDNVLEILVKSINKVIKKNIVITSKDKVLVSSDKKYIGHELSNSIISKIEKRDTFSSLVPIKINLFNEIMEVSYIVNPVLVSGDIVGSVIVFSNDDIDSVSVECINVVEKFLEIYLEE